MEQASSTDPDDLPRLSCPSLRQDNDMSSADADDNPAPTPKCRAWTGDAYTGLTGIDNNGKQRSNFFRQAQFSPDGSTIITHNEDHCLRTFIVPYDQFKEDNEQKLLEPYSCYRSGINIQSYAIYPGFNLQNTASTLILSGATSVPITLRNALNLDGIQSSYPFVHATTEEHRQARSLTFTRDGTHFIAGSDNVFAAFDCFRDGAGPLLTHKVRSRGRRALQTDSWSMSRTGIVSALGISCDALLAIGTTSREIGLFENEGLGQCASTFQLEEGHGTGVTDVRWSPDGTYLLIAERQSEVVQVYDVRVTHRMVTTLHGRTANTPQKLGIDVAPTADGYEVWAGGTDGTARMWKNPGSKGPVHSPDAIAQMHEAPISSAVWDHSGSVLATCAGQQSISLVNDDGGSEDESEPVVGKAFDNTLKVWTL